MSLPLSTIGMHVTAEAVDDEVQERRLVELAKTDSAAMGRLYQAHYPAIKTYVCRRVSDSNAAEDIISDTFVAMVKCLPKYRSRGIPFRVWLYRIATNLISKWAKRRQRWAMGQWEESERCETESDAVRAPDVEMIELVMATLPPRLQSVLSLHYLEGMKIAEIADVVDRSIGTVKSQLHDGRSLMRSRLEKRGFTNDQ
jgi:RNA polymerase sigma-70 factor (ECF subfamily)